MSKYTSLEHITTLDNFASLAYPARRDFRAPPERSEPSRRENFTDLSHYSGVESFKVPGVADKSNLSASELMQYLRTVPRAFVWFYAPWCGHCVHSKDAVSAAAKESSTPFVAYNADQPGADAVSRKFNVRSFPTFVMVERGEPVEWFKDERTKAAFVKFAQ